MTDRADVNDNEKKWGKIKQKEISKGKIKGLNNRNNQIGLSMLQDFELGLNTNERGKKKPATLLKCRYALQKTQKEIKEHFGRNRDFDKLNQKEISSLCNAVGKEQFATNLKMVYAYMNKTNITPTHLAEHIKPSDYSQGKPKWVYLNEDNFRKVSQKGNEDFRTITLTLLDSGLRAEEMWKVRVNFFSEDFTILDIPLKYNGGKVSKTIPRKMKLKLSSGLIKDYVKRHKLEGEDFLVQITQAGYIKTLRKHTLESVGDVMSEGGEKTSKITITDIRHISACYWLVRYPTERQLMYRMGWTRSDRVHYYSEFKNLSDTIDDDDMLSQEDRNKYEVEIKNLKDTIKVMHDNTQRVEEKVNLFFNLVKEKGIAPEQMLMVQGK